MTRTIASSMYPPVFSDCASSASVAIASGESRSRHGLYGCSSSVAGSMQITVTGQPNSWQILGQLTMLYLAVDKLVLKYTLRASPIN